MFLPVGYIGIYIGIKAPAIVLYIMAVGILLSCYILKNQNMDTYICCCCL